MQHILAPKSSAPPLEPDLVYVTFKRSPLPKADTTPKGKLIPIHVVVAPDTPERNGCILIVDPSKLKSISDRFPGVYGKTGHFQQILGYGYSDPQPDSSRLRAYFNTKNKRYVYSITKITGTDYAEKEMKIWVPTKKFPGTIPIYTYFRPLVGDRDYRDAEYRESARKFGFTSDTRLCFSFRKAIRSNKNL